MLPTSTGDWRHWRQHPMQWSSDLNTVLPTNHNPLETHGQHVSNMIWIMSHRKRTYIYILVLHRIVNILFRTPPHRIVNTTPHSKYTVLVLRRFDPLTAPSVSQVAKPLHWSSMHAIWIHHIWLVQVVVFYMITFVRICEHLHQKCSQWLCIKYKCL